MLATRGEDGFFHARPMATLEAREFDGTLWFLDRPSAPTRSISCDGRTARC